MDDVIKQVNSIPKSWEEFVTLAVEVHKAKHIDYEDAFMDMLVDERANGRIIWAWEVKKKLDRLRRWIKKGKLLVKGEGVLDSIIDLCNYTVQYDISHKMHPYSFLPADKFRAHYEFMGRMCIIRYLTDPSCGLSKPLLDYGDMTDDRVLDLLLRYMGTKD